MKTLRDTPFLPAIAILAAFVLLDYLLYLVSGFDAFALTVAAGLGIIVTLASGRDGISPRLVRTLGASAALVMAFMPGVIVVARGFAWSLTTYDLLLAGSLALACGLGFGGIFLLRYQLDYAPQRAD